MKYDIIGDIHGHREELEILFKKLGYEEDPRLGWQPPNDVMAIFLGDFIDRGPDSRGVIKIVRKMMDAGRAMAVMGNHEYNAICYYTHVPLHGHLRPHSAKNVCQHRTFLKQYENDPVAWFEVVEWFMTLPLFLELDGGLRVVHACWDDTEINKAREHEQLLDLRMTFPFLYASAQKRSMEHNIIETLLKGPEEELDEPITDADGETRDTGRVEWWKNYSKDKTPVVFGHYWWKEEKGPNIGKSWAWIDHSVAKKGELACLRWRGGMDGRLFHESEIVTVPAIIAQTQ